VDSTWKINNIISTIIFNEESGDFDVFSADHISADAGNTTTLMKPVSKPFSNRGIWGTTTTRFWSRHGLYSKCRNVEV
jgi:hypothetical protein